MAEGEGCRTIMEKELGPNDFSRVTDFLTFFCFSSGTQRRSNEGRGAIRGGGKGKQGSKGNKKTKVFH